MAKYITDIVRDVPLEVDVQIIHMETALIVSILDRLGETAPDINIGIIHEILRRSGDAEQDRQNDGKKSAFHVLLKMLTAKIAN